MLVVSKRLAKAIRLADNGEYYAHILALEAKMWTQEGRELIAAHKAAEEKFSLYLSWRVEDRKEDVPF